MDTCTNESFSLSSSLFLEPMKQTHNLFRDRDAHWDTSQVSRVWFLTSGTQL